MFGISSFELLVILLVGVIVLGPERLPKILRLASRAASELRRLTTDLQRSINLEAHLHEHNASLKEQARDLFFGEAKNKNKSTQTAGDKNPDEAAHDAGSKKPDETAPSAASVGAENAPVTAGAEEDKGRQA